MYSLEGGQGAVENARPREINQDTMRDYNLGFRLVEYARMLANNNNTSIQEEFRYLVELACTWQSLSIPRQDNQTRTLPPASDSYVINVEDHPNVEGPSQNPPVHDQNRRTMAIDHFLSGIREGTGDGTGEGQNNNNRTEEYTTEMTPEMRTLLNEVKKYMGFVLILIFKGIYDYRVGVMNFGLYVIFHLTFTTADKVLKCEIAKRNNKSWLSLFNIMCYIGAFIIFVHFKFETHLFSFDTQPLTLWDLLWTVLVNDFLLALITIAVKVLFTCLPGRLLALQKRGKYYLMIEATSQLYRCIVPIQPWLYYLLEAYQGPEKYLGFVFAAMYIINKGKDMLYHIRLFRTAFSKLLQNVSLGVSPSKEQLLASGTTCAICHEEYSIPVRLHCKHIFCEMCISMWLDREKSCPLCRAAITDDPIYRDGHTTHFVRWF